MCTMEQRDVVQIYGDALRKKCPYSELFGVTVEKLGCI